MKRIIVTAVLSLILTALSTPWAGAGEGDCDPGDPLCGGTPTTTGDQGTGSVVTEGVQFPNTDPNSDLGRAVAGTKGCKNCQWAVSPACIDSGPSEAACAGATVGCANPGDLRYRVYLRRGNGPWVLQGTVCLGPGERPTSVSDIGAAVRELVVNYLPDAHPSFQPRAGGIVNLPTLFAAGESSTMRTEPFDVLGFTVVVTASAHWVWTFERGATENFAEPGGGYPDQSVSHTYRRPGQRRVSVTTWWRAQFTVNGEGPFAVPGPELTMTAGPFAVPVRSARSELVGG
jgi:hypothetical protein